MDFELSTLSSSRATQTTADALLVLVADQDRVPRSDDVLGEFVHAAIQRGDLEEGIGKCLTCYRPQGFKASRLVLVRAGDGRAASVRKAVQQAMAAVKAPGVRKLTVFLSWLESDIEAVRAAMMAVAEASYVYTHTKPSAKERSVERVQLGVRNAADARAVFRMGQAQVAGTELVKEWANRPANHATPSHLADVARKLGRKANITTEVLGPKEVQALGMGAFMAVAQGSAQPLRFIVMRYQGAAKSVAPVVLVGKGITFDTGGISIKPAAEMDEMKFDMGGAASVLGTFAALAQWQPAVNVIGLIPACENMPDGKAVKPGDVVTSMSGQTIEVLNTDAEGRLILCDALCYAARFKPQCVIDIATLTGACVIALGSVRTGLFANRDDLAQALQAAGERALDPCWRMPLDPEYAEGLKSNFADMGNVAGRAAGAVTAAKFLQKFVAELPWAHLDIAGTAWKGGAAKGATGRPVSLLLQYLDDLAHAVPGKPARAVGRGNGKTSRK